MVKNSPQSKRVVMIVYPDAQVLDITGPTEVFSIANRYLQLHYPNAPKPYKIEWWAKRRGVVAMSSGLELNIQRSYRDDFSSIDTLMVPGGRGLEKAMNDRGLIDFLQNTASSVRRIASVCTGTFLLAKAGLLADKKVTTHWGAAQDLQQQFPELRVEADALYIKQGNTYTSAGVTAGIDLALSLIEEDLGKSIVSHVAKQLVVFLHRPGNQAQFSNVLKQQSSLPGDMSDFHDWLLANLEKAITVETMASQCSLSPRHFARRFAHCMRTTPAKYLESLRVDQARMLLEDGQTSLKTVAYSCGFHSVEQLRRSFSRLLGVTPSDYQMRF